MPLGFGMPPRVGVGEKEMEFAHTRTTNNLNHNTLHCQAPPLFLLCLCFLPVATFANTSGRVMRDVRFRV
jgi:hypothetical protein